MVYDMAVHNINGHAALKLTQQQLKAQAKTSTQKPMIFTDSTWPGSGAYGAAIITD